MIYIKEYKSEKSLRNMSSDSIDSERNKKFYLLKSRKNFHNWKEKTLSNASSQGYERFLLENVKVETESTLQRMMIIVEES